MNDDDHSWVTVVVVIALIWGGYSLFNSDESDEPEYGTQAGSQSNYREDRITEEDGYIWAEDNDVSTFAECQDEFGASYEEDECNRYVKENYSGFDTFNGYECTEDCSGHEAGYNWAEENNISNEYDCDGNSNSFNEGCESYVEENY